MWWLTVKNPPRSVQSPEAVASTPQGDEKPHNSSSWGCSKRSVVCLQEHQTALHCSGHFTSLRHTSSISSTTQKAPPLAKGLRQAPPYMCHHLLSSSPFSLALSNTPLLMPTCSNPLFNVSGTVNRWLPYELIRIVIAVSENLGEYAAYSSQCHRQDLLKCTSTHANRHLCINNTGRSSLQR